MNTTAYNPDQPGAQPPYLHPDYVATIKRSPRRKLVRLEQTLSEITGPVFAPNGWAGPDVTDLTRGAKGEAVGQRIMVTGRVCDEAGRPVPNTLLELWQCNAAGRYRHDNDQHNFPLDPNFIGSGQVVTNANGEYRILTIKPGAYPWTNSYNAWRAQHIHFSVFGPAFATRVVTQMYFSGDPLLAADPVFLSIPDRAARDRMISVYEPDLSQAEYALGYRYNIVLRGREATPRVA